MHFLSYLMLRPMLPCTDEDRYMVSIVCAKLRRYWSRAPQCSPSAALPSLTPKSSLHMCSLPRATRLALPARVPVTNHSHNSVNTPPRLRLPHCSRHQPPRIQSTQLVVWTSTFLPPTTCPKTSTLTNHFGLNKP